MKLIFIDTETTNSDENSRLVQLAYKIPTTGEICNELFKPPVPIQIGAMAVHHITEEMVADKQAFFSSEVRKKLKELLPGNILVAHRASFELKILANEKVETGASIDTLRVARHLIESEQYNLQYLRYLLKLKIQAVAHDALGDVLVLEGLFEYLKKATQEQFQLVTEQAVLKKMMEISQSPVLLKRIPFGRHKGKPFEEIMRQDRAELERMLEDELKKNDHDKHEDVFHTLKKLLQGSI